MGSVVLGTLMHKVPVDFASRSEIVTLLLSPAVVALLTDSMQLYSHRFKQNLHFQSAAKPCLLLAKLSLDQYEMCVAIVKCVHLLMAALPSLA